MNNQIQSLVVTKPNSTKFVGGKTWPVLRSLQGYHSNFISHDLVAGLTLVAIAIPEQLATAKLGGFSPQIGFFFRFACRLHGR